MIPCGVVSAFDDPDINIIIKRGAPSMYGVEITVHNNKSVSVNTSFRAELFGFSHIRHVVREETHEVSPHTHTGMGVDFFTFVPRLISVTCICEKEGKSRTGIILGTFIVFGRYTDVEVLAT
jgi:hypothetical protein